MTKYARPLLLALCCAGACGGVEPTTSGPSPEPTPAPTRSVPLAMAVGEAGRARYVDGVAVYGGAPRLVSLDDGRPLLVWISEEPGGTRIWSVRPRRDDTWPPPQAAPIDLPGTLARLEIASTHDGAVVVAMQNDGGVRKHWTVPIDSSGRPGAATPIDLGLNANFELSRDQRGSPLLAWAPSRERAVWISRYDGAHWSEREQVGTDETGAGLFDVHVVSNGLGALRLLWVQDLSAHHPHARLVGRRWTPGGWTPPVAVSGTVWYIDDVEAAAGPAGDVVATWTWSIGPPPSTLTGAYGLRDSEWRPDGPSVPHVASVRALGVDRRGDAVALVVRPEGDSDVFQAPAGIWASRRTTAGWTPLERIETHEGAWLPAAPQLAVSSEGAALAAWRAAGGLWVNHRTRDRGWAVVRRVGTDVSGDVLAHHVAMAQENAWVAWSAYDGTRITVWAARIDTR